MEGAQAITLLLEQGPEKLRPDHGESPSDSDLSRASGASPKYTPSTPGVNPHARLPKQPAASWGLLPTCHPAPGLSALPRNPQAPLQSLLGWVLARWSVS